MYETILATQPTGRRQFQRVRLHKKLRRNEAAVLEWWQSDDQVIVRQTMGAIGGQGRYHVEKVPASGLLVLVDALLGAGFQEVDLHVQEARSLQARQHPRVEQFLLWIGGEADMALRRTFGADLSAISLQAIDKGRQRLSDVGDAWSAYQQHPGPRSQDYDLWRRLTVTVENYYLAIPSRIRERNAPDVVAEFVSDLHSREEHLNQLEAKLRTNTQSQQTTNEQTSIEGLAISYVEQHDPEHARLTQWVQDTSVHGTTMKVRDVFRVCIAQERRAFEQRTRALQGELVELVHGTKNANMRHILRGGLIIPRFAANGRAFGDGVYFADKASKSGQYCSSQHHEIPRMLLVAQVALGRMHRCSEGINGPPAGYESVKGEAGSRLQWNEYIVYHPSQQTIQYVITFDV